MQSRGCAIDWIRTTGGEVASDKAQDHKRQNSNKNNEMDMTEVLPEYTGSVCGSTDAELRL